MRELVLSFSKTIISAIVLIFLIVGGVFISLHLLKDEAIKTHLKIAKLHVNTFSEQITQVFNYIDLTSDSLITPIYLKNDEQLQIQFNMILANTPYVRSINILDDKQTIIKSSNKQNIGDIIDVQSFYPKPLFDNSLLRFGKNHFGRDISDKGMDKSISYLLLLKEVFINNKTYYIVIALNTDYFTNRYIDSLNEYHAKLHIIRLDGTLLYSSKNDENSINTLIKSKLMDEAISSTISSGQENYNGKEYLSAYYLTDVYPLNIAFKMDLEKSLSQWENKREEIVLLISVLVSFIILLIFIMIYRQKLQRIKEIKSHKKQVEEHKKFKILFEQDIFMSAVLSNDGTIEDINPLGLNFLGKKLDELKEIKFYDLECWTPKVKDMIKPLILADKEIIDVRKEIKVIDALGDAHAIEFILKSIEMDGDYKIFALGLDITEKKEKEEKLKHAYIVYSNTHDGIMITDKDANIIDINDAFVENTGFTMDEVYGQNPRILKSGKVNMDIYKGMWDDLNAKGFWRGELINKDKDGNFYDEVLTVNAIHDDNGEVKNYIGVFTNITKQKLQEKKLKEQEHLLFQQSKMAAMGEMLENIAHQWRQPLSVISMSASGIKLKRQFGLEDESYFDDALDGIVNSTKHLSDTIDDFRNFFKPNKEKHEVFIEDVIERSISIVSSKFKNREIKVIKDIDKIKLNIYDNELIQVIMNIFKNSQDILEKLPADDRYIFVKARVIEDKMILKIKDSGGGIDEEIIDKIFEPYFTTKHQSQGTGIGLYMSEEIIVKHMKGNIYVNNEEYVYDDKEFKGAVFTIGIPL